MSLLVEARKNLLSIILLVEPLDEKFPALRIQPFTYSKFQTHIERLLDNMDYIRAINCFIAYQRIRIATLSFNANILIFWYILLHTGFMILLLLDQIETYQL